MAARPAAPKPKFVAGWAFVDGDAPLVGARVRLFTWTGRPLPGAGTTTFATGTFLLPVRGTLPRTFVIATSGGTVEGQPFRDRLQARVARYTAGRVVYLNPVTSVAEAYLDRHRALSIGHATTLVKDFFDIPRWMTIADLRVYRAYFDGTDFLEAANGEGGMRAFAAQVEHHNLTRTFPGRVDLPNGDGFDWIVDKLTDSAKDYAKDKAVGWVLSQFGLGDGIDAGIADVRAALDQIQAQITDLQNRSAQIFAAIQQSNFNQYALAANRFVGDIKYAQGQLAYIASLPPNSADPSPAQQKAGLTNDLLRFIFANLLAAQEGLNGILAPPAPGADSLFTAAYKVAVANALASKPGPFFGPETSAQIRALFDRYAGWQATLLQLREEYWHSNPTTYTGDYVLSQINFFKCDVGTQPGTDCEKAGRGPSQVSELKSAVPAGTVISVPAQSMWTRTLPVQYTDWYDIGLYREANCNGALLPLGGPPPVGGFTNWQVPTLGEMQAFLRGWSGAHPAAWLEKYGGFAQGFIENTFWTLDPLAPPDDRGQPQRYVVNMVRDANGIPRWLGGDGTTICRRSVSPSTYWYAP